MLRFLSEITGHVTATWTTEFSGHPGLITAAHAEAGRHLAVDYDAVEARQLIVTIATIEHVLSSSSR
jgi:hypothetical protein